MFKCQAISRTDSAKAFNFRLNLLTCYVPETFENMVFRRSQGRKSPTQPQPQPLCLWLWLWLCCAWCTCVPNIWYARSPNRYESVPLNPYQPAHIAACGFAGLTKVPPTQSHNHGHSHSHSHALGVNPSQGGNITLHCHSAILRRAMRPPMGAGQNA